MASVACGPAAAPPAAAPSQTPAAATTAPSPGACPTGAELEALARTHWGIPKSGDLSVECAAGTFGEPAWVIWGTASDVPMPPGDEVELDNQILAAVVTPAGRRIAHSAETGLTFVDIDYGETPAYRPYDLDGDGFDELVTLVSSSRGGYFSVQLTLTRLVDGAFEQNEQRIYVSFDDSGAVDEAPGPTSCDGEVDVGITDGVRWISITNDAPSGDPEVYQETCEAEGMRRYVLRGDELVRMTP